MSNDTPDTKICKTCGQEKPLSEFYKHSTKDGYRNDCKRCHQDKRGHKARFIPPEGMKRCITCKQIKSNTNDYFSKDRAKKDGLARRCKECQKRLDKEWHVAHRDTEEYKADNIARSKRWHQANTERSKRISKAYYEANKESLLERQHIYARTHRDQTAKSRHQWKMNNLSRYRQIQSMAQQRRNAIKKGRLSDFTHDQWDNALKYFNQCCAVCERPRGLFRDLEKEHWISVSKGGAFTVTNILPICGGFDGCNQKKWQHDPEEWVIREFGPRKGKDIIARIKRYFDTVL